MNDGQVTGKQEVTGMLRAQGARNRFTPVNHPERNQWSFADIEQMATVAGTQPVLVDEVFSASASARIDLCSDKLRSRYSGREQPATGQRRPCRSRHRDFAAEYAFDIRHDLVRFVGCYGWVSSNVLPVD
jgi:cytochrome oxidase assembly protein ShyY1